MRRYLGGPVQMSFYTGQSLNEVLRETKNSMSDGYASIFLLLRVCLTWRGLNKAIWGRALEDDAAGTKNSCRPPSHCAEWSCVVWCHPKAPPRQIGHKLAG